MRTIKELLILLREKLPEVINLDGNGSICYATTHLWIGDDNLITLNEMHVLDNYIEEHKPKDAGDYDGPDGSTHFWWPYGELSPRLEFIDKLIAEL